VIGQIGKKACLLKWSQNKNQLFAKKQLEKGLSIKTRRV